MKLKKMPLPAASLCAIILFSASDIFSHPLLRQPKNAAAPVIQETPAIKGKSKFALVAKVTPKVNEFYKNQPVRDAKIRTVDMDSAMTALKKDMKVSWKQIRKWNACFPKQIKQ